MSSPREVLIGLALSLSAALAAPSAAAAQAADAFPDFGRRLHIGDTVRIEDRRGAGHTGTVVDLSPGAIVIDTGAGQLRLTAAETSRIVRRGDPVVNGAIFGFVPGYLLGVQLNEVVSDHLEPASAGVRNGLIAGLIGAAIGMAIDGARRGEREVYAAPSPRVALTPSISRHAVGARVVIGW